MELLLAFALQHLPGPATKPQTCLCVPVELQEKRGILFHQDAVSGTAPAPQASVCLFHPPLMCIQQELPLQHNHAGFGPPAAGREGLRGGKTRENSWIRAQGNKKKNSTSQIVVVVHFLFILFS